MGTLASALSAWESSLRLRGDTEEHILRRVGLCRELLGAAKIESVGRLRPVRVTAALGDCRWTPHMVARRIAAAKAFSRWLFANRLTPYDALLPVGLPRPAKTTNRRAMTDAELTSLLKTTWAGKTRCGMTGQHRAAAYALAAGTGLRVNEIRTLTPESFVLDGDLPRVRVEQRHAKNRKTAEQPLYPELAEDLRPWVMQVGPGSRVFPLPASGAARLLRADMAAAGIDTTGLDFHALRVTFCTRLARKGVSLQQAQVLMRHSTPVLTAGLYTRLTLQEAAAAVARLA